MDFSTRLKDLRCNKGLTQRELAKALNVTKSAISGYESGLRVPSLEGLHAIANYFGVSIDYLTGNSQHYTDEAAAELVNEYFARPELKILFDATKNVTKEDILQVASILEKMGK